MSYKSDSDINPSQCIGKAKEVSDFPSSQTDYSDNNNIDTHKTKNAEFQTKFCIFELLFMILRRDYNLKQRQCANF